MRNGTGRLDVLDVFRGLAVAGMILVTSPGDWMHAYWWLQHAHWQGWTPADMVFPGFLVAVGVALGLSFPRDLSRPGAKAALWGRVLRRVAGLILLGLFVNLLYSLKMLDHAPWIAFPGVDMVRIPGVLQRIALCYLAGVGLILAFPKRLPGGKVDADARVLLLAAAVLLLGYWLLLTFVPVPGYGVGRLDQEGSLAAYLDRTLFTVPHLWPLGSVQWAGPVVYDPEGLLATLPAIVNVLAGILAARALRHGPDLAALLSLLAAGALLAAAGLLLDPYFPIIKPLWTSSFALLSSGFSLIVLAVLAGALQSRAVATLATPLRILGTNAVLGFLLSVVMAKIGEAPWIAGPAGPITPQAWGFGIASTLFADPTLASTACAFGVVGIIVLCLWPLHRRNWRFRL